MFACCAFAVFLLHQLLLPLSTMRRRLAGAPALRAPNEAVTWRPGRAPERAPRNATGLALLLSFELLAGGLAVVASLVLTQDTRDARALAALSSPICNALRTSLP